MNKKKLAVLGCCGAAVIGFCIWQNNMLTVSEYGFSSPKVTPELDGFRIVQVSDLHNKNFGSRLLGKIADLEPDIIVITGDIADSNHTNIRIAGEFMTGAVNIAPVYFISGNHELFLDGGDWAELENYARDAGVTMLRGAVSLSSGCTLIGLGDDELGCGVLAEMKPDPQELNILLAHEPQYIGEYAESGVDLVLTGHAHGGQFRIPFTDIGLIAPDQGFLPKYTSGVHTLGGTEMVISRGLGNSIIPIRLFNFPEIVVVEMRN